MLPMPASWSRSSTPLSLKKARARELLLQGGDPSPSPKGDWVWTAFAHAFRSGRWSDSVWLSGMGSGSQKAEGKSYFICDDFLNKKMINWTINYETCYMDICKSSIYQWFIYTYLWGCETLFLILFAKRDLILLHENGFKFHFKP